MADVVQKLQNRAARVITRKCYEVRSHDIRSRLSWNTLVDRRYDHKPKAFPMISEEGNKTLSSHYQKETAARGAVITAARSCGITLPDSIIV